MKIVFAIHQSKPWVEQVKSKKQKMSFVKEEKHFWAKKLFGHRTCMFFCSFSTFIVNEHFCSYKTS